MQQSLRRVSVLLLLFSALWSCEAESMGKLYVFSEVRGVVVQHGKPVSGAVLEQTYRRGDKEVKRSVSTNERGEFHFPVAVESSFFASILPHQPRIEQEITVKVDGTSTPAWRYVKGNYDDNGELDGRPINLFCEVSAAVKRTPIRGDWDYVSGICELR